ncbi:hypothetical protein B0E48_10020 [Rhodanobacter sp. C03]|nr:hypothetical protein B0E48_10020 [Rhodanobacter sp. C03]
MAVLRRAFAAADGLQLAEVGRSTPAAGERGQLHWLLWAGGWRFADATNRLKVVAVGIDP